MKKLLMVAVATIAFMSVLGIVGSYDYADAVVYSLRNEAYEAMITKIGKASNTEVAAAYFSNRNYYDSL